MASDTRLRDLLLKELDREGAGARRLVERLRDEHLSWRPHPKSFTAGQLGGHLVDCIRWTRQICAADSFEIDPAAYRPFRPQSVDELLRGLDDTLREAHSSVEASDDAHLLASWSLTIAGKARGLRIRVEAIRDFTLSHLIHHRGQLSVYLRLLDVAVPGLYGPTADDRPNG